MATRFKRLASIFGWLSAVPVGLLLLTQCTAEQRPVVAPILGALAVAGLFYGALLHNSDSLPLDEIGTWYVAAIAGYAILPLLAYLALGLTYTPFNDFRLYTAQPGPTTVGRIGWYHVLFLLSFALIYLRTRRTPLERHTAVPVVGRSTALAALTLLGVCQAAMLAMSGMYDLSASSYLESYAVVARLPLGARQLLRMIEGVELVFSLILLVWLFARYQRARWVIFLWLGIVAAQTVIGGGSRTMLMVMLAASTMLYHRFVRPISVMAAVSGAALIFVAFMTLGVVRQSRGRVDAVPFSFGVSAGEFESMFANAVDLEERKQRHEFDIMTPRLYASEIAAAIPSQVLPFQKLDLSAWYLATFYPVFGDSGGGFAFGIVSQAIVGFGVLELILRGALVGYIFARLHRWYRRRNASPWVLIVYLWAVVLAYQSFRNVMTYPLSLFLQHFVPAMLLTLAAKQLIEGAIPGRRGSVQPIATS